MQCRPSDVRAAAVNVGEGQLFSGALLVGRAPTQVNPSSWCARGSTGLVVRRVRPMIVPGRAWREGAQCFAIAP